MKKLLFFGDSITDMNRDRNVGNVMKYGFGFVFLTAARLIGENPNEYEIINKGISGNSVLDLYERYQNDVIAENPDVITILVGVNDIWHKIAASDNRWSELPDFVRLYDEMITGMKAELPNAQIILMEPYITHGAATDPEEKFARFREVFSFAEAVRKLAEKHGLPFVELQDKIEQGQNKYGTDCLYDGVHPDIVGASIISNEWLKTFCKLGKK